MSYSSEYDKRSFHSGKHQLDNWLANFASQSESRFETRTFLAVDIDTNLVLGYYAGKVTSIEPDQANTGLSGYFKLRYPLPAYLLAKLAVDTQFQNLGIGSQLLAHALRGAIDIGNKAGLQLVVVDAIDNDAAAFYGKHDFTRFRDDSERLFIPMATVVASFREID